MIYSSQELQPDVLDSIYLFCSPASSDEKQTLKWKLLNFEAHRIPIEDPNARSITAQINAIKLPLFATKLLRERERRISEEKKERKK